MERFRNGEQLGEIGKKNPTNELDLYQRLGKWRFDVDIPERFSPSLFRPPAVQGPGSKHKLGGFDWWGRLNVGYKMTRLSQRSEFSDLF